MCSGLQAGQVGMVEGARGRWCLRVGTPLGSGSLMSSSRPDFLKLFANLWLIMPGAAPPSLRRGSTRASAFAVSGVEESVCSGLVIGVETAVSISKACKLVGPMLFSGVSLRLKVHAEACAPSFLLKSCSHAQLECNALDPLIMPCSVGHTTRTAACNAVARPRVQHPACTKHNRLLAVEQHWYTTLP